eukprot:scaffold29621_cov33-Attheya_sp.AAC.1
MIARLILPKAHILPRLLNDKPAIHPFAARTHCTTPLHILNDSSMLQFLRKTIRIPGVSFLRSKKLRPTKNRVMKNNLPESISISYLDESLSDDTSHSSDHEMNLSYENWDESILNNGVVDGLGFEETQQICRDIENDMCLNETGLFSEPPTEEEEEKCTVKRTFIPGDDRSITSYNNAAYYYDDEEFDADGLDQSKKVWFHPDEVTEVRYINKERSVSQRNASVHNNLSACVLPFPRIIMRVNTTKWSNSN